MLLGKLTATAKSTVASTLPSPAKFTAAAGRLNRFLRTLAAAFDALVTGSRTIPLGDNGMLIRELGERSGQFRHGGKGWRAP